MSKPIFGIAKGVNRAREAAITIPKPSLAFRLFAFGMALGLGGCQTISGFVPFVAPTNSTSVTQDIAALKVDAQTVVNGLQAILPAVASLDPKYAATIAAIQADIGKASSQLPVLNGFANIADAKGTTQIITTALSDALKLAATLPIPMPYSGAITAANVLLPVLLNYVGLPLPASAMAPVGIVITPAQARLNLQAFVKIAGTH